MDNIQVYCSHSELVDLVALVANPRNPNTHPKKQVELLAKIIKNQGWRNPIVVSKRSGFVVKGHCRLEAAKLLGCDKVPVDYQDYANEAAEWADMIADNRVAELAEQDEDVMKQLLEELSTTELDLDLTGYTAPDLSKIFDEELPEPKEAKAGAEAKEGIEATSQFGVIVLCADEATQKATYEKLVAEGYECKIVAV